MVSRCDLFSFIDKYSEKGHSGSRDIDGITEQSFQLTVAHL